MTTGIAMPEEPWGRINEQQREMIVKALQPLLEQQRQALQPFFQQQSQARTIAKAFQPLFEQQPRAREPKTHRNPPLKPVTDLNAEIPEPLNQDRSAAAHLTDDIRSILGEDAAPWVVALWVFILTVLVRFQIGQVSPGSYPPDVLAHLFEGAMGGVTLGALAKAKVNSLSGLPRQED